ncbi:MAG: DUF4166 domain-containing protein [Rhodospirillales bacterium]
MRVLLLGGSGAFGTRLARLLASDVKLDIVIAGRDPAKAQRVASEVAREGGATISTIACDIDADLAPTLDRVRPQIVVHAAGPFQGQDYRVAQACIARSINYIDLSDGRAFVAGIATLDQAARDANVFVISGASTVPALSAAVVDAAREKFGAIDSIDIAICPGNRAPRGQAVVEAILDYVGKPIPVGNGQRIGWQGLRRVTIPGVGTRWASDCDLPDTALFGARYGATNIRGSAGLELSLLHLGLWLLSWPVRWGWIKSLRPWAKFLLRIARWSERRGSDRGGMRVMIAGKDRNGAKLTHEWSLFAEAGEGPFVPVLAAASLVRRAASGETIAPGARPCLGDVSLAQFQTIMTDLPIATGWSEDAHDHRPSLYRRVLSTRYDVMPEALRVLHDMNNGEATGRAEIDGAATALGGLIARLFGFPRSAEYVPVDVRFTSRHGREAWHGDFAGHRFKSVQHMGAGRWAGLLVERFGPVAFAMRVPVSPQGLDLQIVAGTFLGMPLPRFAIPVIVAGESSDEQSRFVFDVEIGLRLIGRLVRYRGWLVPTTKRDASAGSGTMQAS